MQDTLSKIRFNKTLNTNYRLIGLEVNWPDFVPGQFVMVDVPGNETFLRRPFGIVSVENGILTICFKIVGKGTTRLAGLSAGDSLYVMGPLGNGFDIDSSVKKAILVGGGYGVAPLFGLCKKLEGRGVDVVFLYGAKSRSDIILKDELEKLGVELRISTEDGSLGVKGNITELLEKDIDKYSKYNTICSCGPKGLLDEVSRIGHIYNVPVLISTEEYMSCGIGICLGCVCKDSSGNFVRTCKEGPVFISNEIKLE